MPMHPDNPGAALPSAPFYATNLADETRIVHIAFEVANRAVVSDIESEGHRVELDGRTWWDTRPMTDPHEHAPEVIDMATQAIQYAVGTGLAAVHPQRPYLVTFNHRG